MEKDLNEIAPWGQTWGRTSKRDYKNIVQNLAYEVERLKATIYMFDLLNNPCHESNKLTYEMKRLNKASE